MTPALHSTLARLFPRKSQTSCRRLSARSRSSIRPDNRPSGRSRLDLSAAGSWARNSGDMAPDKLVQEPSLSLIERDASQMLWSSNETPDHVPCAQEAAVSQEIAACSDPNRLVRNFSPASALAGVSSGGACTPAGST